MENAIEIKDATEDNWTVVQILGRGETQLAGPLSEELAIEKFEELTKRKLPGTLAIKDGRGNVVAQLVGFVDDKTRRGKDKDGKPYEPEIVEVGSPARNLSPYAEWIKSLPTAEGEEEGLTYAEWQAKQQTEPPQDPSPTVGWDPVPTDPYGFGAEIAKNLLILRARQAGIREVRRGFVLRLALHVLLGEPLCRGTVKKAFGEAEAEAI